jgi:hypothetical protein
MATMAFSNNSTPAPSSSASNNYERVVALVVAVWIIGLVSYLILSDRPFEPTRVYFVKILLSLSCGIVVGTLPGFFNVDLNTPGFAIRAAGGAAAFVFVYTQSPSVPQLGLAPPDIKISRVHGIDFRSARDPQIDNKFSSQPVAVTATPVEVKNERQPSVIGTLRKTDLAFALGGSEYRLPWYYFVSLLEGPGGTWLTSEGTLRRAVATDLPPGKQFSEEVMHLSDMSLPWDEFISAFRHLDSDLVIKLIISLSVGEIVQECRIVPAKYKLKIESDEKQLGRIPGHVATVCET